MNASCTLAARSSYVRIRTVILMADAEFLEGPGAMTVVAIWTGEHAATLRTAWRMTIEEFAGRLGIVPRTVSKWEADAAFVPPLSMQLILDTALDQAPGDVRTRFDLLHRASSVPLQNAHLPRGPQGDDSLQGDEVAAAAGDADVEQLSLLSGAASEAVAALWDEIVEIARSTSRTPREVFAASRRVRCSAVRLAEETRRPGVLSDLYAIAGQSTALMASTAFDLDQWDAATTLARSAVSYATLVGNPSLQAWTLGLAATLANWRNEPDIALSHFERGLQAAPPGAARVRLRYIAARSLAVLGDHSGVAEVLEQGRRDQDDADGSRDPLSDEVGGEFAFGRARAEACAAAAWLDLGAGREAKEAAQLALAELTSMPASRQPFSQVAGARIDLATACLLQHDRDEAEETLSAVLDAPAAMRNVSLSGRLVRTRNVLHSQYPADDGTVRSLDEAIGEWLAGR